jgi:hypothetical protein
MSETKTSETKLDLDARYVVAGYKGIAQYIYGFPKRWEPYMTFTTCDDPSCVCHDGADQEHEVDSGEGEWVEQDETCGRVIMVMVGDDTKREVDISDLTKLGDLDYCASCGQVGCGHDGRERS